jgi:Tfp pilus assembly protein FimT
MNFCAGNRSARARGLMLVECVVYMAIFLVVTAIATKVFYDCWDSSKAIRRNADDIARSLRAGEQWRADIRAATGPVEKTALNGVETLRIPHASGDVVYTLAKLQLRRRAPSAAEAVVLPNIKSSRMQFEARGGAEVWRWELELMSSKRYARLRPLFTFAAVPATGAVHER